MLVFCFDATLVEDLREPEPGVIEAEFIPEQSDFAGGQSTWHITAAGPDQTRIDFHSRFDPKFWVPPLVGPAIIKRKALHAATDTIRIIETLVRERSVQP